MVSLGQLPMLAVLLVIIGVVLTVGALIEQDIYDDQTAGSYAANISADSLEGLDNMGERQGTLGTVLIAAAIISVIVGIFAYNRGF